MSRRKGMQYEEKASWFLQEQGWIILKRNYYSAYGEIDIIACKGDELAFVEVKGRRRRSSWNEDAIPRSKQRKIRLTAECFLMETEEVYSEYQFAVLWIESGDISWIENAF
jgi:putative endonuclease